MVACVDGSQWVGLDPATGEVQAGPIELGCNPLIPVQHADLDGDGEPEVLALGPGPTRGQRTLSAFSFKSGGEMWSATIDAGYDPDSLSLSAFDHPLIVDVDGDGRSEILVPDAGAMRPLAGYQGVRMVDGLSGVHSMARCHANHTTMAKGGLQKPSSHPTSTATTCAR